MYHAEFPGNISVPKHTHPAVITWGCCLYSSTAGGSFHGTRHIATSIRNPHVLNDECGAGSSVGCVCVGLLCVVMPPFFSGHQSTAVPPIMHHSVLQGTRAAVLLSRFFLDRSKYTAVQQIFENGASMLFVQNARLGK